MEVVELSFLLMEVVFFLSRINGLPVDQLDHFPFYHVKTYSQNDTQLCLSSKNISNILPNAFQNFSALEILDLSHNNLTNEGLPCGSLNIATLRHLNTASNQLTTVPSCLPAALEFLDLSKNVIQQIEFSEFTGLQNLNDLLLSHNKISTIVSSGTVLPHLASLDLSYNNFTKLQWKFQMPNLTMLRLEGNPMQQISPCEFSLFPKLHYLNLSMMSLEVCSYKAFASEMENLKVLDLSANLFKTFDPQWFEGLSNLQILWMRQMPFLQSLPADLFVHTPSLIQVDLEENPQLHFVKSSMFEFLLHLEFLSLKSCNLTEFRPWNFFTNSTITVSLSENPLVCSCELTWLISKPEKIQLNRANYTRCHRKGPQREILLTDLINECDINGNHMQELLVDASTAQTQLLEHTTAVFHNSSDIIIKTSSSKLPVQSSARFQFSISTSSLKTTNVLNTLPFHGSSSDSNSATLQTKESSTQNDKNLIKSESKSRTKTSTSTTTTGQTGTKHYPTNTTGQTGTKHHPTNTTGQTGTKHHPTNTTGQTGTKHYPTNTTGQTGTKHHPTNTTGQTGTKHYPTNTTGQTGTKHHPTNTTGQTGTKHYPTNTTGQTGTKHYPTNTTGQTGTKHYPTNTTGQTGTKHYPTNTTSQTGTKHHPTNTTGQTGTKHYPTNTTGQTGTKRYATTTTSQTGTKHYPTNTTGQTGTKRYATTTTSPTGTKHYPMNTTGETGTKHYPTNTTSQTGTKHYPINTTGQTGTKHYATNTTDQTGIKNYPINTTDQTGTKHYPINTTGQTGTKHYATNTTDQTGIKNYSINTTDQTGTKHYPINTTGQTGTKHYPTTTTSQTGTKHYPTNTTGETGTKHYPTNTTSQTGTKHYPTTTTGQTGTKHYPTNTTSQTGTKHYPTNTTSQTGTKHYPTNTTSQTGTKHYPTNTTDQTWTKHYPTNTTDQIGTKHYPTVTLETSILPEFSSISTTIKKKGPIFIVIEDDDSESLEEEITNPPHVGDCNYDPCRHWQVPCHDLRHLTGCHCPDITGEDVIPDPVKIQKVIRISDNSAEIYWCAPSSTVLHYYIIFQSDDNRHLYKTDTINPTYRRYTLRDLTSDSTYHTCVVAVNKAGSSTASSIWPSKGPCYIFKTKPNYNNIFYITSTAIIAILFILVIILSICLCRIRQKGRLTDLSRISLNPLSLQNPAFDDHLELADPRSVINADSEQIP